MSASIQAVAVAKEYREMHLDHGEFTDGGMIDAIHEVIHNTGPHKQLTNQFKLQVIEALLDM